MIDNLDNHSMPPDESLAGTRGDWSSASRQQILLIDDTPANLMVLGDMLAREFDLRIATSGAEGLRLAAEQHPALILLDVMMPEMDGFEVCRRLKADPLLKDIPVIFVTAASESEAETSGLALGAIDYITKPIQVEIARQRIHNQLEREALRRQVEATALLAAGRLTELKLQFMRAVSHELRTPLNGIVGLTGIALRARDLEKAQATCRRIQEVTGNLLGMIENILDFGDAHAGTLAIVPGAFDLAALVDKLVVLWQPRAIVKGLTFTVSGQPDGPELRLGDAQRIEQVLGQLLANAVKFTEQGNVAFTLVREPGHVLFAIQDSGIGMSAEELSTAFNPFEQADGRLSRRFGGIGLALSLVRLLVEQMGGSVGVDSSPGVGTRFDVRLPLPME